MQKIDFKIQIDAPREKVWEILWGDNSYNQWTSVFAEGSRAETDWQKGSKVLFLDGKKSGMVSFIVEKIANEFMSFKHMGIVKDGVEDMNDAALKGWAGAIENYTLKNVDGKTELAVDMDITEEFKDMFSQKWQQAMQKIKELSEK